MQQEISLQMMTRALCHALYREWENDPAMMEHFVPYQYDEAAVDRYFDAKQEPSRILFAIMKGKRPIGEMHLKWIDRERRECTLSIHLQKDSVKGRGYGTQAERLALRYAFDVLGMDRVKADVLITNARSRHVLEKVGFQCIKEEKGFRYYQCERERFEKDGGTAEGRADL